MAKNLFRVFVSYLVMSKVIITLTLKYLTLLAHIDDRGSLFCIAVFLARITEHQFLNNLKVALYYMHTSMHENI